MTLVSPLRWGVCVCVWHVWIDVKLLWVCFDRVSFIICRGLEQACRAPLNKALCSVLRISLETSSDVPAKLWSPVVQGLLRFHSMYLGLSVRTDLSEQLIQVSTCIHVFICSSTSWTHLGFYIITLYPGWFVGFLGIQFPTDRHNDPCLIKCVIHGGSDMVPWTHWREPKMGECWPIWPPNLHFYISNSFK